MKIIIFIRHFNDFDNVLPIVDYLIRVKHQKDIEIYGSRGVDYLKCNKHLDYVTSVLGNNVMSFIDTHVTKIDKFLLKIINKIKEVEPPKNKITKLIFNIFIINLIRFIKLFIGSSIERFVSSLPDKTVILADFGTEGGFPYKYLIKYCQIRQINIFAYLHGYSIYSNVDSYKSKKPILNDKLNRFVQKIIFGKHSNRQYDKYLVGKQQTETYFKSSNFDGFSAHSRIIEIGLPRYTKEWIDRFVKQGDIFYSALALKSKFNKYDAGGKINVTLFTSHLRFNVDEDKLNKTIEMLVLCKGINLIIKAHTRGNIPKLILDNFSEFSKYICDYDSSEIIEWADIGIVYGTSMSIQMLSEGLIVIVPSYIDSNKTILEDNKVCVNAYSLEYMHNFLLNYPAVKNVPNKDVVNSFLKEFVYGNKDTYEELMDEFCYFLYK